MNEFSMKTPSDWHVHFRDGNALSSTVPPTAAQMGAALVMPNLVPPIATVEQALEYQSQVTLNMPHDRFRAYMALYLTDNTTATMIHQASKYPDIIAVKSYPKGGTTNSDNGLTDWNKAIPVLEAMEGLGIVLCLHGETLQSDVFGDSTRQGRVGILRREKVFLQETAEWIVKTFPRLRIVIEHITTAEAVNFVTEAPNNVGATITAHHLLATLDDAIASNHNKCMPILKEEPHRQSLLDAATSGNPKFFAGTDSAPHAKSKKETACGCAGCFTALHAIELYATAFEERNALDCMEGFMSVHGVQFYGVDIPRGTVTLQREPWKIPEKISYGNDFLVPFWAGKTLQWRAYRN